MKKKKSLILFSLALISASASVMAQAPSHENYIGQTKEQFYQAYQNWTPESPVLYNDVKEDEQFYISRVRLKDRFVNSETQVKKDLDPERKLLWWCPIGVEKWNGMPSYYFDSEVFSMWSYVDLYGNWTAPFVRMPGAFIDACHKNGVKTSVLASVPWNSNVTENDGGHGSNIHAIANGGTEKFLTFLRYYGIDGIGFNSEFNANATITNDLKTLLTGAFKDREKYNWPSFTNAWYSLMNNSGQVSSVDQLTSSNKDWFHYNGFPTSDAYFMNYNWGLSKLQESERTATSFSGRSSYDVYAGMDFQGRNYADWLALKKTKISVGLWGAHNMNMIYENRAERGADDLVKQQTYQLISENVFTGSSYNPVNTPAIQNKLAHTTSATDFHGFSSFISARSTLITDDLAKEPFVTYFNLGNGRFFNVKGERQFDGEWYNISIQDYLPTWRWWWTSNFMGRSADNVPEAGLTAEFTWDDAWFGGSCLAIYGETAQEYLQLFKTEYPLKSGDKFTIRYKVLRGTATLNWSLSAKGEEASAISTKIGDLTADEDIWVEKVIEVGKLPINVQMDGKTLAMLGLRFDNASKDFKMLIGEISIKRTATETPSAPTLVSSKELSANYKGVDFKMTFKMKDSQNAEPVYNDEVNTWYYKIYYQQENCEPVMCTATTSWAAYVVGAPYDAEGGDKFKVGVSAVSIDGDSESDITWSDFMDIPELKIIEGIKIDKPVIKENEEFTIGFVDPNHAEATWSIYRSEDGSQVGESITGHSITTSLSEVGIYNLQYVCNGETVKRDGMIQISGQEVGAMPRIEELKVNGSAESATVKKDDVVTYTYVGRNADGSVSRGLTLGEKAFGLTADQLNFNDQSPFTLTFWFYPLRYNHQDQGTQFLNIRSPEDKWPASDWGYIWSTITKENKFMLSFRKTSNEGTQVDIEDVAFTDNQWHHVALVIGYDNGRSLSLYVNGKYVGGKSGITDLYSWKNSNIIMIGGAAAFRAGLDATIDEVQLYNKALTAEEVKKSMQHIDNPDASLIGYWDFESEAAEDNFIFSTGSNKDLKAGLLKVVIEGEGDNKYEASQVTYAAGAPFIPGSNFKIETLPTWKFDKNATVTSSDGNSTEGSAEVSYKADGNYTATLTLQNGWGSDTKTFPVVVVDSGSGIDESAVSTDVYPNPFENELYINFAESGAYTVQVYSLAGNLVSEQGISAAQGDVVRVAVNAAPGTYLVNVLNKDAKIVKTVKVVKK